MGARQHISARQKGFWTIIFQKDCIDIEVSIGNAMFEQKTDYTDRFSNKNF